MRALLIFLAMLLSGCLGTKTMLSWKEHKAAAALQDAFGAQNTWQISPLQGGLSGASIFIADNGSHKYVVRFFDHLPPSQVARLLNGQKNAWTGGYGPKVHWANPKQSVVVMDYLQPQQPNPETIMQDLATLLRKIHTSPMGEGTTRYWDHVFSVVIKKLEEVPQTILDVPTVKSYLEKLVEKAAENLESKTCHRDMNPTNLIFCSGRFFAVDYDSLGIDDPYIDIAQVATFYCHTPAATKKLLSAYLEREPTDVETTKLTLFQKIVLISYGLDFFGNIPDTLWTHKPELMPFRQFIRMVGSLGQSCYTVKTRLYHDQRRHERKLNFTCFCNQSHP